jgi:transcriptional regulator with XRE-family HTH domain
MINEADLGKTIAKFRIKRGLTLQELADKTGYTKGYLSKIEKAEKAPPVSTLINIAKALNIRLADIFGENSNSNPICLVKRGERQSIARDGSIFGYAYESLAHKYHSKQMEPYLLSLPVHPRKNAIFQHRGEEMMFMLEGTMKFFYGDQEYLVEEGDCIYFDASIAHYGVCHGEQEAKCLMVIYSPE